MKTKLIVRGLTQPLDSTLLTMKLIVFSISIVLLSMNMAIGQQQPSHTITGKIVDSKGVPMPMVNVLIKGTSQGVLSSNDGTYSINIPASVMNPVLLFSFIGFTDREETVGSRSEINLTLTELASELDEVVVVGYGVQKKANLTGSLSVIKFDKEMENRPITNASQALSGTASGVWVSQNSGSPGNDGTTIRVRGYGTLNNTDPLILIDGVEGRFSEVNPNDIESITVLKDAASAAIYGSRAANGVILVETKKGGGEEKISLNYNGYIGVQSLGMRYNLITNSAEYMELWNSALANTGSSPLFPNDVIQGFRSGTDPFRYPNTNYLNEVFRAAPITQHNVSVTANGKIATTYLAADYLMQEGILKNTNANRIGLTFNNTTSITKWLKIGARARIMRKKTEQAYDGIERVVYMISNGHPFSTPYLRDGSTFGGTQALYLTGDKAGQPIVDTRNPFLDLYNGQDYHNYNFYKANVFATVEFMKGLTLTSQYSGQYSNDLRDRFNQPHYTYTDIGINRSKPLDFPSTLKIFRGSEDEYYSTFFSNLNFYRTLAEKHELSAMLGVQTEDFTKKTFSAEKSNPPKDDLHQVDAGTTDPVAKGNTTRWRMLSYFGRVNYALMGKYLFEANLRADASSRFAKGNRWGYFPSFSAAWRLSEENFVKNTEVFSNLKIRTSWGKLGNQKIDNNWPFLTAITQSNGTSYNFNGQFAPGAAVTTLVDPNISWETTTTTNIGVDLGFLRNRLSVEADYFYKVTKDIIVQLPIPLLLGNKTAPFENVGEMENKGVELTINWRDQLDNSGVRYGLGLNFTYVGNTVSKFQGGKSPDQLYLIREGYSYKTLYGFQAEGIYQTDKEATDHMGKNAYVPVRGDIRYKDVNKDGKLDYQDKGEIGNTIPKITYGINGNVSWRGFDLAFLFQGISKVTGYMQNAWTIPLGISGGTITERWRDAWTDARPSQTLPRLTVNDTWNRQESSFWATDMSWFKLKNVQLGYSVPKALTSKWSIGNLYIYLNGTNLFTMVKSSYEGFDPERDTFGDGYNQYPNAKVYSCGINLTF